MRLVILLIALLVFLSSSVTLTAQTSQNNVRVDWNSDGTLLALASSDGNVYIYDDAGELVHTLNAHEGGVVGISWSPDGNLLATSGWNDTFVRIWDADTWILLHELPGHNSYVSWIAWEPNQSKLIAIGLNQVYIWAAINWQLDDSFSFPSAGEAQWDPISGRATIAGLPGYVVLFSNNLEEAITLMEIEGDRLSSIDWSPDGTRIITSTDNGFVRLRDALSPTLTEIITFDAPPVPATQVAFSPNGSFVAGTLRNGEVWIWNAETGEVIEVILNPDVEFATSPSWNPVSGELAYGYGGGPLNNVPNIIAVSAPTAATECDR